MRTDGGPQLQSNEHWKLEVVQSAAHTRHTSGRACVMLIPAPAQTAVGFWLGKGCGVQVECVYSNIWQGPGGILACSCIFMKQPHLDDSWVSCVSPAVCWET